MTSLTTIIERQVRESVEDSLRRYVGENTANATTDLFRNNPEIRAKLERLISVALDQALADLQPEEPR